MSAEIEVIVYSVAAPAAAALAVGWLLRALLPATASGRYSLAVAIAAAFFLGYWLLPDWAPLVPLPHRQWQWLGYVSALVALVSGLCLAGGVSIAERWLMYLVLAALVAWRVVPSRLNLWPPQV